MKSKKQQSCLPCQHTLFQLKYIPVHLLPPVEPKDEHIERLALLPDDETKWISNFDGFVLQISCFGRYAGGYGFVALPSLQAWILISAVPTKASGSVNLQGGD